MTRSEKKAFIAMLCDPQKMPYGRLLSDFKTLMVQADGDDDIIQLIHRLRVTAIRRGLGAPKKRGRHEYQEKAPNHLRPDARP